MDESDFEHAARLEQQLRDAAIARARKGVQVRPDDFDGTCAACNEPVVSARVEAGYFNCVDCAAQEEYRARLRITRQ